MLFVKKSAEIGEKTISIEVGKLARLAHGSAVVTLGETVVLTTVGEADPRPGIDFFPLTVEYREKTYAAGKIPGFVNLYAGEEAIAVGVCAHLTDADFITSTHRGHGHCIAKGVSVREMMAEIFAILGFEPTLGSDIVSPWGSRRVPATTHLDALRACPDSQVSGRLSSGDGDHAVAPLAFRCV